MLVFNNFAENKSNVFKRYNRDNVQSMVYFAPSWVTDEEFGMGYLDLKPAPAPAPASKSGNAVVLQNGTGNGAQAEQMGAREHDRLNKR
ncbi:hypothetical protein CASFOL_018576 [Castilleja foliolosa]|uniref:Uncharacterized protein n=1 Tax=Castilleja foliolosa TaxID=1961234 RepID=A0ABD3D539_9LAMI